MPIEKIHQMGRDLSSNLQLTYMPVAVTLLTDNQRPPEGISRIGHQMAHCQMVDKARRDGSQFYSLIDDQQCKNGAAVMGMGHMTPEFASGKEHYEEGHYRTIELARDSIQQCPRLEANSTEAILYAPLTEANFIPDVVIILDVPEKAMQVSQSLLYNVGGSIDANFAGILSLCADGVVKPYKSGNISISLGCVGSRNCGNIAKDEMIIGIPMEKLQYIVDGASRMFSYSS
ncbi:DUF169 domain-containing protein [Methanohalophilus sp.]